MGVLLEGEGTNRLSGAMGGPLGLHRRGSSRTPLVVGQLETDNEPTRMLITS